MHKMNMCHVYHVSCLTQIKLHYNRELWNVLLNAVIYDWSRTAFHNWGYLGGTNTTKETVTVRPVNASNRRRSMTSASCCHSLHRRSRRSWSARRASFRSIVSHTFRSTRVSSSSQLASIELGAPPLSTCNTQLDRLINIHPYTQNLNMSMF